MIVNEFQERIKEYTKALPKMKEKVAACALLLCISMVMMTTVSFAWLVRSAAPEVRGMTSTIAANGNLEIALASGSKTAPGESKVGDGDPDKTMQQRNLTWGNLINLADAAYGLENIVLRPAQLNRAALATSPLYGAEYDKDGRITKLVSNFGYAVYNPDRGLFEISEETEYRGVRAISSTKTEYLSEPTPELEAYDEVVEDIEALNLSAVNQYLQLANNKAQMNSLTTLMGAYMTARLNASQTDASADFTNPAVSSEDVQNLRDMYILFQDAFETEADAIAKMLNLYVFLKDVAAAKAANPSGENLNIKFKETYTRDYVLGTTADGSKLSATELKSLLSAADKTKHPNWTLISNIATFQSDYSKISVSIEELNELVEQGGTIRWKDEIAWRDETKTTKIVMNTIVARLVDVGTCTVSNSSSPTPTKVNNIGASNATNYVGKDNEAVITNGILWNFERRTGAKIRVEKLTIKASIYRGVLLQLKDQEISANVSTNADVEGTPYFITDFTNIKANSDGLFAVGVQSAKDTYGLAVDFWIRTNSQGNHLTLEDAVVRETQTVTDQGKDADGITVDLYTLNRTAEDDGGKSVTITYTLYKKTANDGTETWYNADNHVEFTLATDDNGKVTETPTEKKIQVEVVTGLAGANRVWEDGTPGLVDNSTTQGNGSCYVFYADTPEDQARSLTLLESMYVAFVDANGKLLAIAGMDTESYWAENGRVTVPLVLEASDCLDLGTDATGKEIRAITALEQNVSMMVTALVYLDGTYLSNEDVLASADIQGQLNIQFGTTVALYPLTDEALASQALTVSATADNKTFDYDTATEPMTTNVTVTIDGTEPKKVEAFFLRKINSTQGSRENTVTFTKNADGTWAGAFTFTAPGNYVLRSVRIDGIEYFLSELVEVTVNGFTIESLSWDFGTANTYTIMTAEGSSSINTKLKFASSDLSKMPKTVQGRFLREDGVAANIVYTYNSTSGMWEGTATFVTSGVYTLQYLVLDGEYTELAESQWKTATVNLGMKVAVYTTSPISFKFLPSEMTEEQKNLQMQVKIMDNTGEEMRGIRGEIKLYYRLDGSAVGGMDADLTWDESSGYYLGVFHPEQAGRYLFSTVSVTPTGATASNTITAATTSPTFVLLPPNPPALYTENETKPLNSTYQYNTNGTATLSVDLDYSAGTTVYGVIRNLATNEETIVEGTSALVTGNIYRWRFTIPTAGEKNTQDGNWQLVAVKVSNYYDQEGNLVETPTYDEDGNKISGDEMVIDLTARAVYYTTKVVATINVVFDSFDDDYEGTFLQSHSVTGLAATVTDFENHPLDDAILSMLSEITVTLTYDRGTSKTYGGYTAEVTNGLNLTTGTNVPAITITLIPGETYANDGQFVQDSTAVSLLYAGSYTATASGGIAFTSTNLPTFTVTSTTPSVTITAMTPTGSNPTKITYTTKKNWNGTQPTFTATGNQSSSFTKYEATVYAVATADNDTQRHGGFTQPKLTLTVAGVDSSCSVSVVLPGGSANEVTFTRTGNGTIQQTLGKVSQINSWSEWAFVTLTHTLSAYYGHGTQKIETMTVTKDGVTYTITLEKPLEITNPSSVNQ